MGIGKPSYTDSNHTYRDSGGIKVAPTTSILKYLFNEGEYRGDPTSGLIGTELHNIAAHLVLGDSIDEDSIDESIPEGKIKALRSAVEDLKLDPFEQKLIELWGVNEKIRYGWRADLILPERKLIIDWKSGVLNHERDKLQLMAYLYGYFDKNKINKKDLRKWTLSPVYLKESGLYQKPEFRFSKTEWQLFCYAATIVNYYKYF